jgi:hypothetical protein
METFLNENFFGVKFYLLFQTAINFWRRIEPKGLPADYPWIREQFTSHYQFILRELDRSLPSNTS